MAHRKKEYCGTRNFMGKQRMLFLTANCFQYVVNSCLLKMYLQTFFINTITETNSVDPDQTVPSAAV